MINPDAESADNELLLAATARRLSEENATLRATLGQVLAQFSRYSDQGGRCVSTGALPVTLVERWHAILADLTGPVPASAARPIGAAPTDADEAACALCGCTEDAACEGGCAWFPNRLGREVCTACVHALTLDTAGLAVEEIYLVTDPDTAEPCAWIEQRDAATAALDAVRADWTSSMGDARAHLSLKPTGGGSRRWEVLVNAPGCDIIDDPSGVTVHRLILHGPHLRPEDVWLPGSTAWGVGARSQTGAPFTSRHMSEQEARAHLATMRGLFPENAATYALLRWSTGPAVVVREEQADEQPAV